MRLRQPFPRRFQLTVADEEAKLHRIVEVAGRSYEAEADHCHGLR